MQHLSFNLSSHLDVERLMIVWRNWKKIKQRWQRWWIKYQANIMHSMTISNSKWAKAVVDDRLLLSARLCQLLTLINLKSWSILYCFLFRPRRCLISTHRTWNGKGRYTWVKEQSDSQRRFMSRRSPNVNILLGRTRNYSTKWAIRWKGNTNYVCSNLKNPSYSHR